MTIDLSLVLASYNSGKFLGKSLREIEEVMDKSNLSYEIIYIDDASKDDSQETIKNICKKDPEKLRYVFHEKNQGRGAAIKTGIKAAKGEVIGYIDPDLETPAYYIPILTKEVKKGYDIVTGLRIYTLDPIWMHRTIASMGYRYLVRLMIKMKFKDSESGCKFFNREKILKILPYTPSNGWFWDTEIMMEPYFKGYKIKEMPTLFLRRIEEKGSTLKLFKDSKEYFLKLLHYRKRLKKRGLL